MGQQFLDLEGTKILANKIKEGERKVAFVGSDSPNSDGWYKVASQTCSGFGDTNITFMVTSTFLNYNFGILQLQIRSDDTNIHCPRFSWLVRDGFDINHFVIVINGMTWTLYAYQPSSRYGRICFEILSMSSIDRKDMTWTLNFKDNYTKETTVPQANYKSIDINSHHTHSNKAVLDKITEANVETMNDIASGIGGRNLVENSQTLNNTFNKIDAFNGTKTISEDSSAKSGKVVKIECTTAGKGFFCNLWSGDDSNISKKFTWSFYAKMNTNKTLSNIGHERGGVTSISVTTEWQKFTHTWTYSSSGNRAFIFYPNFAVGDILYIKDFKIEEGSIATDWTPAPEDMLKKGCTWNELEGK